MVEPGIAGRRGPAPEPLHPVPRVVPVLSDHRKVQHGHGDLPGIAPELLAVPTEHLDLVVEGDLVAGDVAGVTPPRRHPQSPSLATPADDHGDVAERAGITGRLRETHALP